MYLTQTDEPLTYKQAIHGNESVQWKSSIQDELNS